MRFLDEALSVQDPAQEERADQVLGRGRAGEPPAVVQHVAGGEQVAAHGGFTEPLGDLGLAVHGLLVLVAQGLQDRGADGGEQGAAEQDGHQPLEEGFFFVILSVGAAVQGFLLELFKGHVALDSGLEEPFLEADQFDHF